jgi:predicted metal-dependent phosphoesterase TrpH
MTKDVTKDISTTFANFHVPASPKPHKIHLLLELIGMMYKIFLFIRSNITMRFELHCHSSYSKRQNIPWEGLASPRETARALHKKGIRGFAITDHDSIMAWKDAAREAKKLDMVFIPALEVTTDAGHLIALGINETIKPGLSVDETVEKIRGQGGVSVAPHPLDIRSEGIGREFLRSPDALEIFNSMNLTRFEDAMARHEAARLGKPAVGGSDAHSVDMLGLTVNHIDADSVDSALRRIRKGQVTLEGRYVPMNVFTGWIRGRMQRSYDDILRYIDRNYSYPKAVMARFLLKRFVEHEWRAWNALGHFAVGISRIYSYLNFVMG